ACVNLSAGDAAQETADIRGDARCNAEIRCAVEIGDQKCEKSVGLEASYLVLLKLLQPRLEERDARDLGRGMRPRRPERFPLLPCDRQRRSPAVAAQDHVNEPASFKGTGIRYRDVEIMEILPQHGGQPGVGRRQSLLHLL